jgi:C-terminal processing protease CtpA/Prc
MKRKVFAAVLALIITLVPVSSLAQTEGTFNIANAVKKYIDANYKYEMNDDAVIEFLMKELLTRNPELFEEVAKSMLNNLDEHSKYYTKEEFAEFFAYVENEYAGIGAYLVSEGEYCKITGFLEGAPAEKAGLMAGDIIYKINGEIVTGLDSNAVANKARGEVGTPV